MVLISAVIPSYNDLPRLQRAIASMRTQMNMDADLELIVVDDGSTDGTAGWLETRPAAVTPVILTENSGRSAARNAGLQQAQGDYILFMDADLQADPGLVQAHLRTANEETVSLGRVTLTDNNWSGCFQSYMETRGAWKYRDGGALPGRYFVTCNALVHRKLIERTGLFLNSLKHWGGEDLEYGVRLEKAGARFVFNQQALTRHDQQRTLAQHLVKMNDYGRWNLPEILRQHPELITVLQTDLLLAERTPGIKGRFFRSVLRRPLPGLLIALEKVIPFACLPDRLYDLALFSATLNGLEKGDHEWRKL